MKTLSYIVTIAIALSGCSFGMHLDRLEDGSRLQTTYRKDRFVDQRSGMSYAQEASKPAPARALEVETSPREGWQGWAK